MAAVVADLDVVLATARQGRDLVSRILSFTRTSEPRRVKTDFATLELAPIPWTLGLSGQRTIAQVGLDFVRGSVAVV